MSADDHRATTCLELTLIAIAHARIYADALDQDTLDDDDRLYDSHLLDVDEAMELFEQTSLALVEYAALLGLTDEH